LSLSYLININVTKLELICSNNGSGIVFCKSKSEAISIAKASSSAHSADNTRLQQAAFLLLLVSEPVLNLDD
jgi:replicative superfamily II helicase